MRRVVGRVSGFFLPLAAVITLTVLLIFALARLAQIQQDMRTNVSANMLWVLTQTQVTGLRLRATLYEQIHDGEHADDVIRAYGLLLSRLKLLSDGPQVRYLDALGGAHGLVKHIKTVQDLRPSVSQAAGTDTDAVLYLLDVLNSLDAELAAIANRTMVAQWEETGSRLDRYGDGVLTVIFLMLGISFCSFIISVRMFIALRRLRESEWTKRQALQLQSQLDAERQVVELHRSFGAMVSHQFRTPLAIIDASMQRLLRAGEHIDRDQLVYRIQKVRRAIARLARLVDHIRIADQYSDVLEIDLQRCALWQLVQGIVQQQREITPDRVITMAPADMSLPDAYCDPLLVEHIVFNFLSNAVKYSPVGKPIHVHVFYRAGKVCCAVQDQGIGLSESDMPYLFDRYFRGQGVATIQGTGIGLYVARHLAAMQDGTVEAGHVTQGGSIFSVCFPVADTMMLEQNNENCGTARQAADFMH